MFKKLLLCTLVSLLSVTVMQGCSGKKEEPAAVDEPKEEIQAEAAPEPENAANDADNTAVAADNTRIVLGVREYIGDNIAEIPYIEYDGEINPEIESINRSINQGIRQMYDDFMRESDENRWMEIRSYQFTDDDYLQAVVWYCQYPTYGTDGNIFSVNYDRKAEKSLSVNDALNALGMNETDVETEVARLLEQELERSDMVMTELSVTGFVMSKDLESVMLLLEIETGTNAEDTWKRLYSYKPEIDELKLLEDIPLFDTEQIQSIDSGLSDITFSTDDGYKLLVNYYSNTYVTDYEDGNKILGQINVDESDLFYEAVFECIDNMEIRKSEISAGSIPSEISEFSLMSGDEEKPSFEVLFYDYSKTVFFHGSMEYDSAVYAASPDINTYFRLQELIGEIRLGAADFEWAYEYSVYDTINVPMFYSFHIVNIGEHYALVDQQQNVIDKSKTETDELLSLMNISDRSSDYPTGLGKHMRIIDVDNNIIAWVYFDTDLSKMYIYPETEGNAGTLFGTYSITPDTVQYAEELLNYL